MKDINKLQKDFADAVMSKDVSKISGQISQHKSVSKSGQLGIYTNDYYAGLLKVLEQVFPGTQKLVGKDFFKGMSNEFCAKNPPESGNLDEYGGKFSAFIKDFPPAKSLPYLSKFAAFEWLYHCAQIADDAPILLPQDMQEFTAEE